MNEYYIPEWWYQTFLVITFTFAVLALVSFIIYKKKVDNEIDSLTKNSIRLYKENEELGQIKKALLSENSKLAAENDRLHSNDLHEHIVTTIHPTTKFSAYIKDVKTHEEIELAKKYCLKKLIDSDNFDKFVDWRIEKDIYYCTNNLIAVIEVVDPGKTQCDHPDKCHECDKIIFCNYWR